MTQGKVHDAYFRLHGLSVAVPHVCNGDVGIDLP